MVREAAKASLNHSESGKTTKVGLLKKGLHPPSSGFVEKAKQNPATLLRNDLRAQTQSLQNYLSNNRQLLSAFKKGSKTIFGASGSAQLRLFCAEVGKLIDKYSTRVSKEDLWESILAAGERLETVCAELALLKQIIRDHLYARVLEGAGISWDRTKFRSEGTLSLFQSFATPHSFSESEALFIESENEANIVVATILRDAVLDCELALENDPSALNADTRGRYSELLQLVVSCAIWCSTRSRCFKSLHKVSEALLQLLKLGEGLPNTLVERSDAISLVLRSLQGCKTSPTKTEATNWMSLYATLFDGVIRAGGGQEVLETIAINANKLWTEVCGSQYVEELGEEATLLLYRARVSAFCKGELELRLQRSVLAASASWEKKRLITSISELLSLGDAEQALYVLEGTEVIGKQSMTDQHGKVIVEESTLKGAINPQCSPVDAVASELPFTVQFGAFSFPQEIQAEARRFRQALLYDMLILLRPFLKSYALLFRACVHALHDLQGLPLRCANLSMETSVGALASMCSARVSAHRVKWFQKSGKNITLVKGRQGCEAVADLTAQTILRIANELILKTPKTALSLGVYALRSNNNSTATNASNPLLAVPDSASFALQFVSRALLAEDKIGRYVAEGSTWETIANCFEILQAEPRYAESWQLVHVSAKDLLYFSRFLWLIGDIRQVVLIRYLYDKIGDAAELQYELFKTFSVDMSDELNWRCTVLAVAEVCAVFVPRTPLENVTNSGSQTKPSTLKKQQAGSTPSGSKQCPETFDWSLPCNDPPSIVKWISNKLRRSLMEGCSGGQSSGKFYTECLYGLLNLAKPVYSCLNFQSQGEFDSKVFDDLGEEFVESILSTFWSLITTLAQNTEVDRRLVLIAGAKSALYRELQSRYADAIGILESAIQVGLISTNTYGNRLYGHSNTPLAFLASEEVPDFLVELEAPTLQVEVGCLLLDLYASFFRCHLSLEYDTKRRKQEQKDKESYLLHHKVPQSRRIVSTLPLLSSVTKKNRVIEAVLMLAMSAFGYNLEEKDRLKYLIKAQKLCREELALESAFVKHALAYQLNGAAALNDTLVVSRSSGALSVVPKFNESTFIKDGQRQADSATFYMLVGKDAFPAGPVSLKNVELFGCGVPLRLRHPYLSERLHPLTIRGLEVNTPYVFGSILCSNTLGTPLTATILNPCTACIASIPLPTFYLDSLCIRRLLSKNPPIEGPSLTCASEVFLNFKLSDRELPWSDEAASEWVDMAKSSQASLLSNPEAHVRYLNAMPACLLAEWLDCRVRYLLVTQAAEISPLKSLHELLNASGLLQNLTLFAHWSIHYGQPPMRSLSILVHGFNHALKLFHFGVPCFKDSTYAFKLIFLLTQLQPKLGSLGINQSNLLEATLVPLSVRILRIWRAHKLEKSTLALCEYLLGLLEPFGDSGELKIYCSLTLEHSWFGTKAQTADVGANAVKTTTQSKRNASVGNNQQLTKVKRIIWYTEYLFHALLAKGSRNVPVKAQLSKITYLKEYLVELIVLSPLNSPSVLGPTSPIGSIVSSAVVEKRILDSVITKKEFYLLVRLNLLEQLWQELTKFKKNTRWLELVCQLLNFATERNDYVLAQRLCGEVFDTLQQRNLSLFDFGKEFAGRAQRLFSSKPSQAASSTQCGSSSTLSLHGNLQTQVGGSSMSINNKLNVSRKHGDRVAENKLDSVPQEDDMENSLRERDERSEEMESDDSDSSEADGSRSHTQGARAALTGASVATSGISRATPLVGLRSRPLGRQSSAAANFGKTALRFRHRLLAKPELFELIESHVRDTVTVEAHSLKRARTTNQQLKASVSQPTTLFAELNPLYIPLSALLTQLTSGGDGVISTTNGGNAANNQINLRARKDTKAQLLAQLDSDKKTRLIRALDALENLFCNLWQSSRYKRRARLLAAAEAPERARINLIQATANLQLFLSAYYKQVLNYQTNIAGTVTTHNPPQPMFSGKPLSCFAAVQRLLCEREVSKGLGPDQWNKNLSKFVHSIGRAVIIADRFRLPRLVLQGCMELWRVFNFLSLIFQESALAINFSMPFQQAAGALLSALADMLRNGGSLLSSEKLGFIDKPNSPIALSLSWVREFVLTSLSLLSATNKSKAFAELALTAANVFSCSALAAHEEDFHFKEFLAPLIDHSLALLEQIHLSQSSGRGILVKVYRQHLCQTFPDHSFTGCTESLTFEKLVEYFKGDSKNLYSLVSSALYSSEKLAPKLLDKVENVYCLLVKADLPLTLRYHVTLDYCLLRPDAAGTQGQLKKLVQSLLEFEQFEQDFDLQARLPEALERVMQAPETMSASLDNVERSLLLVIAFYQLAKATGDRDLGARALYVKAIIATLSALHANYPQCFGEVHAETFELFNPLTSALSSSRLRLKLELILELVAYTCGERLTHFRLLLETGATVAEQEVTAALRVCDVGIHLSSSFGATSLSVASLSLVKAQLLTFCQKIDDKLKALKLMLDVATGNTLSKTERGIVSHKFVNAAQVANAATTLTFFTARETVFGDGGGMALAHAAEDFLTFQGRDEAVSLYGTDFFSVEFEIARLSLLYDLFRMRQFDYTKAWEQDSLSHNIPQSCFNTPADRATTARRMNESFSTGAVDEDDKRSVFGTQFVWPKLTQIIASIINSLWSWCEDQLKASTSNTYASLFHTVQLLFVQHLRLCKEPGKLSLILENLLGNRGAQSLSNCTVRTNLLLRFLLVNALFESSKFEKVQSEALCGVTEAKEVNSTLFFVEFGSVLAKLHGLFPQTPLYDCTSLLKEPMIVALRHSSAEFVSFYDLQMQLGEDVTSLVAGKQSKMEQSYAGRLSLLAWKFAAGDLQGAEALYNMFSDTDYQKNSLALALQDLRSFSSAFNMDTAVEAVNRIARAQPWNFALVQRISTNVVSSLVSQDDAVNPDALAHWCHFAGTNFVTYKKLYKMSLTGVEPSRVMSTLAPWVLDCSPTFHSGKAAFHTGAIVDNLDKRSEKLAQKVSGVGSVAKVIVDELFAVLKEGLKYSNDSSFANPYPWLIRTSSFQLGALFESLTSQIPALKELSVSRVSLMNPVEPFMSIIWTRVKSRESLEVERALLLGVLVVKQEDLNINWKSMTLKATEIRALQQDLATVQYMLNQHESTKGPETLASAKDLFREVQTKLQSKFFGELQSPVAPVDLSQSSLVELTNILTYDVPVYFVCKEAFQESNFKKQFTACLEISQRADAK